MKPFDYEERILQSVLSDCRRNLTFRELKKKYPVEHYELLSYLYSFYLDGVRKLDMNYLISEIRKNIICYEVKDSRLGIVSDLHFGSKEYSQEYVDLAYQNMYQKGVREVFVCGDFLDGFMNQSRKNADFTKQLRSFLESLPSYDNLVHIVLLGNHDLVFLERLDFLHLVRMHRPDIIITGVERAYLKFHKRVLEFYHQIRQDHLPVPMMKDADIYMKGHTHQFQAKRDLSIIYLDPLCKQTKNGEIPGYSILKKQKADYFLEHYHVDRDQAVRTLLLDCKD